ncbi:MAG: flagellar biosynthesis anti-sigma factor FlgM [Desulfobacterales bacterium]
MKISGNDPSVLFDAYARRASETTSPQGKGAQGELDPTGTDKVVLSPRARELQEASRELHRIPDVDEQRVGRVLDIVDQGGYRIDGGRIAEKMLNEVMSANVFLE